MVGLGKMEFTDEGKREQLVDVNNTGGNGEREWMRSERGNLCACETVS